MTKSRTLAVLLPAILLTSLLGGCQFIQDSARDIRSTFDQTVENAREKAGEIQHSVDEKVGQVTETVDSIKQKVDETKAAVDEKMQQLDEAGKKIDEAKEAIGEANQAIQDLTR